MPACARILKPARLMLLTGMACLTACSEPAASKRFELVRLDANWSNGTVRLECEQQLELSDEAREALIHGVPLTIELELALRDTASQIRVTDKTRLYEIRYLPMSDHYQLTHVGEQTVRTFPRLRHVLAALSELRISFDTGVLPSGEYEIMARTRLDQDSMPPPMRLPVLLSAKWRHDSSWSSWPLDIEPGT